MRYNRSSMGLQHHSVHHGGFWHHSWVISQFCRNCNFCCFVVNWCGRKLVHLYSEKTDDRPVDSAVFLEFLPGSHQWLLTVMSIWWSFGQIVGTLVAWPLIANYACNSARGCTRENNMGWRYFLFAYSSSFPYVSLLEWEA